MKKTKLFSVLLLAIVFLASCSSEKRLYSSGYQVKWFGGTGLTSKMKSHKNFVEAASSNSSTAISEKAEASVLEVYPTVTPVAAKSEPILTASVSSSSVILAMKKNAMPEIAQVSATDVKTTETTSSVSSFKAKSKMLLKKPYSANAAGGKSKIAALLLCFFLGGLGIHRFYLGYTGIGLIQLFTGGGFGIWFIIDFFRILLGDLKPKDGDYK